MYMIDVEKWATAWEGVHPQTIVTEAVQWGLKWTLACSFSCEDVVILHWLSQTGRAVDVFWLDTGLLFPETYAFIDVVTARYPGTFRRIPPSLSLQAQAARYGEALWRQDPYSLPTSLSEMERPVIR